MNIENCNTYIQGLRDKHPLENDTRYGAAMTAIRKHYFGDFAFDEKKPTKTTGDLPIYVMFVTDGSTTDTSLTENSSTYGILISPAANKVSVLFNPSLRYSNINNIKAVTGTAIDACRDANGVLKGASSKIEIQDNFIADAKLSGVNFETLSGPNSYQVSFLTNSIHRNDGGRRGIYLQGSGAGPWHYHAPYPSANWIGQTRYVELAGAISAGPAIKNDFGPLRNVIAQNAYMTWNP